MPKVIDCYADGPWVDSYRNNYIKWKFGKPKHRYYVNNRRATVKKFDPWDQYVVDHCGTGHTIAWDSAGYYLDGIIPNLTVVDLEPVVQSWYPQARIYTDEGTVEDLYHSADNFMINNTVRLRWRTFDYLTNFWQNTARFFRPECQVFFSFRDIFIFHNRLKYHFSDLLEQWIDRMTPLGFDPVRVSYEKIPVTSDITEIAQVPEIDDMVNGNIKIHWQYRCT
jgi:hypothetical protein